MGEALLRQVSGSHSDLRGACYPSVSMRSIVFHLSRGCTGVATRWWTLRGVLVCDRTVGACVSLTVRWPTLSLRSLSAEADRVGMPVTVGWGRLVGQAGSNLQLPPNAEQSALPD